MGSRRSGARPGRGRAVTAGIRRRFPDGMARGKGIRMEAEDVNTHRRPIPVCLAASVLVFSAAVSLRAGEKRFIELGWDIPDTAFLREHHRQMEEEGPFDGVIFRVEATTGEGKTVSTQGGWNREPWPRDWFEPALADLQACQFTRFTHNFIRFNATPARLAWEDEDAWRVLADKLRLCAWLAREGGAKGIAPDFEPYGQNQWKYDPAGGRSFAETAALARRRGAQFTRGIASEMPEAVVLTLFLNSVVLRAGRADDPAALLAREPYGLLPAFFDGMLDAAPPGMVIVDGCENGYYLDSVEAYQRAALDIRSWTGPAIRLVAPENRATYRQQVQAGFGFYLDMFVNEPGHQYYRPPLEGSRLQRLARNLRAARDAADEYVWIYGEQCRWWSGLAKDGPWREAQLKDTAGKGRAWEEALPGITRAIRWIRDPAGAARHELADLRRRGAATNLLVNAAFVEGPRGGDTLPPGWSAWQHEESPAGTIAWDEAVGAGAMRASKVYWGCLLQKVPAVPGQVFVVQARCHARGSTQPGLTVRWQTDDGHWTREADDCPFAFASASGPGEWRTASGVVTVPPGTGQLVLLLDVRRQQTEDDVCWFDEAEVWRLPDPVF